jgi:transcription elongation factor GreA
MQKTPMTALGAERLREELQDLKSVQRPEVIKAISEARAHGDLKENAEYHAAREKQGFIEARIRDIEAKLSTSQIIDIANIPNEGKVIFGATVTVIDVTSDNATTYQIVGEDEADIKQGKVSITSPLARSLVGKMIGDEVAVNTPGGEITYEIDTVEY